MVCYGPCFLWCLWLLLWLRSVVSAAHLGSGSRFWRMRLSEKVFRPLHPACTLALALVIAVVLLCGVWCHDAMIDLVGGRCVGVELSCASPPTNRPQTRCHAGLQDGVFGFLTARRRPTRILGCCRSRRAVAGYTRHSTTCVCGAMASGFSEQPGSKPFGSNSDFEK